MKYVKTLGLLAVAAAALTAFAASASATSITSSTGETPLVKAHAIGPVPLTLHGVLTVTCSASEIEGTVSEHGSTSTVKGSISKLTFTTCGTNHVTVLNKGTGTAGTGTLEVHGTSTTGNGTLTSDGTRVTIEMTSFPSFPINCIYETQNTHIGTYEAASSTMEIEAANIPRVNGDSGIFCGGNGTLTGEYEVTHPTGLHIH